MSRDEFVRIVTADQPDAPAYFTYDAVLNAKERPTLDEALESELQPLSLEEVLALRRRGRPGPRHARSGRLRGRPPRGQRQHRPRRQLRDLVRDAPRPRAADRDRRRPRARGGGGAAAGPHRLRHRRRLPRRAACRPSRRAPTSSSGPSGSRPEPSPSSSRRRAPARARRSDATREWQRAAHRRQPQHPAQPARRAARRAPARSPARRALRERLPLLDRRQRPAAATGSARSPTSSAAGGVGIVGRRRGARRTARRLTRPPRRT